MWPSAGPSITAWTSCCPSRAPSLPATMASRTRSSSTRPGRSECRACHRCGVLPARPTTPAPIMVLTLANTLALRPTTPAPIMVLTLANTLAHTLVLPQALTLVLTLVLTLATWATSATRAILATRASIPATQGSPATQVHLTCLAGSHNQNLPLLLPLEARTPNTTTRTRSGCTTSCLHGVHPVRPVLLAAL